MHVTDTPYVSMLTTQCPEISEKILYRAVAELKNLGIFYKNWGALVLPTHGVTKIADRGIKCLNLEFFYLIKFYPFILKTNFERTYLFTERNLKVFKISLKKLLFSHDFRFIAVTVTKKNLELLWYYLRMALTFEVLLYFDC